VQLGIARLFFAVLGLVAVLAFGVSAGAASIVGGGLAQSIACADGASPCSTAANFTLDPPTPTKLTTGSITFGPTTATITLTVPSYSMTGSSGSVTDLDFTNVTYSATVGITVFDLGGGILQIDQTVGLATGTVSGTYDEVGGTASRSLFDDTVSFSNLSCFLIDGVGQCGLDVGSLAQSADLALDVDGVGHDMVQTFNVIVPEPSTIALLGLGLLALAARRR